MLCAVNAAVWALSGAELATDVTDYHISAGALSWRPCPLPGREGPALHWALGEADR